MAIEKKRVSELPIVSDEQIQNVDVFVYNRANGDSERAPFTKLLEPAQSAVDQIQSDWENDLKPEVQGAISNANNAATAANTAKDAANTAATAANQAADSVNTAITNANTAATNANDKATAAQTATTNAVAATEAANTATEAANTAAENANDKAADAQIATTNANTAAQRANDAADAIDDITGAVQSDWDETNPASLNYIKNKPTGLADITNTAQLLKDVPYVLTPNSNGSQQHTAQEAVVGGRNLLTNYNSPSAFVANAGSVLTRSVVEVPEWGATDANRIVSSGGTTVVKAVRSFGIIPEGLKRTASVWVKNNSDKILTVHSNMVGLTVTIAPGESKLVIFRYPTTGPSYAQIQFRAPSASDDIDVTWWRIMYEEGHIPSTAVPAPEDMATIQTIAQNTVLGRTAAGNGEPNVGIPFSQTATANTLVRRNANSRIEAEAATTNKEVVNLEQLNQMFNGRIVTKQYPEDKPAIGEPNKFYLVQLEENGTVYSMWSWVEKSGVWDWQSLGTNAIDLTDYPQRAEMLAALALKADKSIVKTATLLSTGWVDDTANSGFFRYTVLDADILESSIVKQTAFDDDELKKGQEAGVQDFTTMSAGQFVMRSLSAPTVDIKINYVIQS